MAQLSRVLHCGPVVNTVNRLAVLKSYSRSRRVVSKQSFRFCNKIQLLFRQIKAFLEVLYEIVGQSQLANSPSICLRLAYTKYWRTCISRKVVKLRNSRSVKASCPVPEQLEFGSTSLLQSKPQILNPVRK